MNRILLLAVLLLLVSRMTPAQVEVGSKAPAVQWETVFESDPQSLAQCKGKLVLLYFMRPAEVKDKVKVARFNGWYDLFKKRGLLLVCVFKQKTDFLEEWVDEHKIEFPLVSGRDVYKKFDVKVYPAYYLISGEGKVLHRDWREEPTRKMLEHYLASHVAALEIPKGKPYDKILSAWKKKQFGEVSVLIAKAKESATDTTVKDHLEKAQTSLQGQMINVGQEMVTLVRGPDYWAAYNRCLEIEKQFKGLDLAAKAKNIRKGFRGDKRIMKEMKAIQELRRIQKRYDLQKQPSKAVKLKEKLRAFISKHPGTGASRLATDALDEIQ